MCIRDSYCTVLPLHNCVSGLAPDPHPSALGPKDAGPHKAPLRPSTRPTASRSCAHSRSTSLANTQGSAHGVPNAQTTPRSAHAPATTRASIPPDVSPSPMPENHTAERIQSSILIYNCSTSAELGLSLVAPPLLPNPRVK